MMSELIPCPVCTLFLHKGMSLAEHLDTHPKEQVIRALVSLATIPSPFTEQQSPASTITTSSTTSPTVTTGTTTLSKSSNLLPPPLISPPVLQSLTSVTTTINSQLNCNTTTSVTSLNSGTTSTTTVSSVTDNITTCGKSNNTNTKNGNDRQQQQQQQQNFPVTNRQNELYYQIGSDGQTNHPVINYSNNNNNQHLNSHQQTHLQDLFIYQNKATKKLPPPPTYGTAISQLRSQNNQSNYGRTQSMTNTLNYQTSSSLNNCGAGGGSSCNNQNNIRHNSETLDYSLPKQQQPTHTNSNLLLSPRHKKSQNSTATQSKVQPQQQSSSPLSSGHNLNQQQLIKKHLHRTPSPTISLIPQNLSSSSSSSSPRQAPSPSVLRYAESPISVQYIERDNGDFLVQESPRHIVQCFEKDDGQFSVIEKVIRSPPALVQIDEFEENDASLVINNNNKLDNDIKIKTTENIKEENRNQNLINKNENNNNNNVDPCTSKSSKHIENNNNNNIKIDDDDDDIILINVETPPRRHNPNGIKVLSNVKLDPNESLGIMENINKIGVRYGSEHFFQSIVQSIKKEEDLKIITNNIIATTITDNEKMINQQNNCLDLDNLNKLKKTINTDEIPCSNIPNTSTSTNSSGTTSVIRLAGQKDDLNKITNNIIPTCTVDLTINKPSTSCRGNENMKPYKKNPKKLIVKFRNPIIPKTNEINQISNNVTEIINLDEPEAILPVDIPNNNNLLNTNIVDEINKKSNENNEDDKINIILDINETVFSVTEIKENDNDNDDCKMDIDCYKITDLNDIPSTSLGKIENAEEKLDLMHNNNNNSMEIETEIQNSTNNKNDKLIENLNKIETIAVVIELPENNSKNTAESSSINSDTNDRQSLNSFILNSSSTTSSSSKSSLEELCSKPSTSSLLSQTDLQNQNQQQQPVTNNYNDYPFSFLYTATTGIQNNNNNNNAIGSNNILESSLQHNNSNNHQICTNNLSSLGYHQNSEAATTDLFQHHYNNNNNDCTTIFQSNSHLNELEDEKSSYLDLDACSSKPITSCSTTTSNCSIGVGGILSNHDHIPLTDALNIRTDEKMPAKGEISEQESNGDIENSWSQPLYTELAYKFPNPYDHFVSRESWSLSHDDFFVPHDLSTSGRTKFIPEKSLQQSAQTISEVTSTISSTSATKKKSHKKSTVTITSTATTVASTAITPESSNQQQQSSSVVSVKRKIFKCEHCGIIFVRLKDRNSHLIDQHQYKRVNRRLVRELPSSTVTSASIMNNQILTEPKLEPIDSTTTMTTTNNILDNGNIIKTENSDDLMELQTTLATTLDNQDNTEDKKPILPVVSTKIEPTNFPRTKYDSIRANVYRMLMNFNLSVLQQKGGIDVEEKKLFESKSFCCYTCKRDFISVKLYDEHLAEHAAECFTCNKKFSRWTYFSLHLKRHLGWKDFWCTQCDKKFVIRSALIEHIRTHTGIAPLKCNICTKSFKRYSNLTQHKKICHSKKPIRTKEYVCYCGEVLPSKARYLWHKEIHDPKPKCCPWCRDRFVHANSLRRHIRLMHSDKFSYSEPVECTICNQVYAKSSLKSHMTTHSMDTQHECPICNKSFSTKWNLKIHSWVHASRTAKPFKCEYCTKAFVREIDYKNHMNSHKQIRPYTCEYCGCKFIRKYNYMRHRREHHGQKKFSCDLCSKLFHRHYYLIEHRRIHTGERPFLCTICGKSSTTKTNHNKHLKIHHSRDPFTSES